MQVRQIFLGICGAAFVANDELLGTEMIHICSGWDYWTIGVYKIKLCMIFGSLTPSLKISVSNVKLRLLLLIMFVLIRIISNVTIWCYRSITLQFTHNRMLQCNRLGTVTLAATMRTSTRRLVKSWGGWRRASMTTTSTSRETTSSAPSAGGTSPQGLLQPHESCRIHQLLPP